MILPVYVDELNFSINVGAGINDFAWLALTASKLYSKRKNPNANYLPTLLQVKDAEGDTYTPHPRTKLFDIIVKRERDRETDKEKEVFDDTNIFYVTIKRSN